MRTRNRWFLFLATGFFLAACSAGRLGIVTLEVPHIIREIQYVTVEVPRIETQVQLATVIVTQIVRETVVVTPAPPAEWRLAVIPGVSLGVPRTMHTATPLSDGRILLAGGSNGINDMYDLVELFDPASGVLTPVAPLNTPRHGHIATLLGDNRVLVVGGYNAYQGWLADAEIYDLLTNTWTVIPPLYPHSVQHTATLLRDGRLLVAGGCISSGVCTDRVEIFDPATDSWTEAASLPNDLASHGALLLDDGRVLVAGGAGSAGGGKAWIYDPQANTWSDAGSMLQARVQAPLIKLLDGRVLAVGGLSISDAPLPLASAEIYDPASNTWMQAASLAQPRYGHNLVILSDGQVLALGGAQSYDYPAGSPAGGPWREASFVKALETYDPVHNRWYKAGELVQPEAYAASVPLPDGRLWVTGGGAGTDMSKAWADTWLLGAQASQP